jgi:hypothetical protein
VEGSGLNRGHGYVCEGDRAVFLGEECELLDGSIIFQVAV